ncbi:hypothetical protein [Streptomyces sp. NPDC006631]|uniref:hypothetical protein n=1 Tax=Streptomyces sp. NPDC006631 TaxID=3364752 RepID=UPI0036870DA0
MGSARHSIKAYGKHRTRLGDPKNIKAPTRRAGAAFLFPDPRFTVRALPADNR